jgi:acyl transferase domain-containing protein/NADP-dependent 3-hydroxy acid dehydrogenase YdfG
MADEDLIAVVGLAGRFPDAEDVEQFWRNLLQGRECLTDLSDEQLLARGEEPELLRHPRYVRRRPLLPGMEDFDAQFFGMTVREAEIRDPQHRIFLETCQTLLHGAGYDGHTYPGSVGIFAGVNATRYDDLYLRRHPDLVKGVGELAIETSTHPDYLTTFVAYKLGLRGPAVTMGTACSTSLVAVHLGCQALRAGDCDMAIAGGAEVEWPYGVGYVHRSGGIYSPDGYCRPFDADAAGTVFGSGVGAVLLKRHSDALRDRDSVYALIRGSAVNNDGSDKVAFSAPSVSGQTNCVAEALASADVDPATISYVEAHGTATALGDPIELKALTAAFRLTGGEAATGYCGIGSVKSNVGHLGPAAGIAGFIKTVLALHHEQIPPTANFVAPNPALDIGSTPFYVVAGAAPWPRVPGAPRRAGCSSFGIGGTNAHVVLEEAPPQPVRPDDGTAQLLPLSAATATALEQSRHRLAEHLAWTGTTLRDAGHTLRVGRAGMAHRAVVVAADVDEAVAALTTDPGSAEPAEPPAAVVLVFPGQGAQRPGMAHGVHRWDAAFRDVFDPCLDILSELLHRDVRRLWREGDEVQLAETVVAQPLLFAVEYAMASRLLQLDVPVTTVLGHSLGELVAAVIAGVFTAETGMRVVAARAQAMQAMPPGAMLAVAGGPELVDPLLSAELVIAAMNQPGETVLSGPEPAVAAAAEELARQHVHTVRLRTSHAYHSPLMAEAAERLRVVVAGLERHPPRIPVLSAASATFEDEQLTVPEFWSEQLQRPVRFASAVAALLARHEAATLVEVGPGGSIGRLVRAHPGCGGAVTCLQTLPDSTPEQQYRTYLSTVGKLWRAGHGLDLSRWDGDGRRVALPAYPFERKRHFIDRPRADQPSVSLEEAGGSANDAVPAAAGRTDREADSVGAMLGAVTWTPVAAVDEATDDGVSATALTLLPTDPESARTLLTVVQRARLRPLQVTSGAPSVRGGLVLPSTDRDSTMNLVRGLAEAGRLPDVIVHGLLLEPDRTDADLERGFYSLLWLVQAVQRFRSAAGLARWRLVVLTRHAVDVSGAEPLSAERHMVLGLLRTLDREIDSVSYQFVDVGARFRTDVAVAALRRRAEPVVAVRGGQLWKPAVQLVRSVPQRTLRRRGVYVITGGLGALGRVAALALAGTGLMPRLVLLGRRASEDLADDDVGGFLEELRAAGAEVLTLAVDVGDEAGLARALGRARERFGPVNGVLHAAGVAGGGLLELRTRQRVEEVLRAKVTGGRLLHRLLAAEDDLDFIVHFGSRAAVSGLVGSGDYAAANGYLEALASLHDHGDRRVVCVAWPGWAEAGMAVGQSHPPATVPGTAPLPAGAASVPAPSPVRMRLTGDEWFLREHRVAGTPVLSGTTCVDLLVRAAHQSGLVPAERPVVLRDLAFVAPLVVARPVTVELQFTPAGEAFLVEVRASPTEEAWTVHCRGVLAPAQDEPVDVDLTDIYDALQAGPGLLPDEAPGLFSCGPRWHNVVRTVIADGRLLVELALPESCRADLDEHPAHPALLDNATSVLQHDAGGPHVPFSYREAIFFRPLPAELIAVGRPAPAAARGFLTGDADLYDLRGRQLARIRGFGMRRVESGAFADVVIAGSDPVAVDQAATAPTTTSTAGGDLLAPAVGAAMLLSIIEGAPAANLTVLLEPAPPTRERPEQPLPDVLERPGADVPVVPVPTADTVVERLRALWQEILGDPVTSPDADFLDLGGTSLSVVQLIARIRDTFGVELGVGLVFEKTTLRELAAELHRMGA